MAFLFESPGDGFPHLSSGSIVAYCCDAINPHSCTAAPRSRGCTTNGKCPAGRCRGSAYGTPGTRWSGIVPPETPGTWHGWCNHTTSEWKRSLGEGIARQFQKREPPRHESTRQLLTTKTRGQEKIYFLGVSVLLWFENLVPLCLGGSFAGFCCAIPGVAQLAPDAGIVL